jgi:predicted outer membrane repeat protein
MQRNLGLGRHLHAGAARSDSFIVRPGSGVYGGFAGTETARTQADPVAHATILSGDIGTVGDASDNSYHVVTMDGTTSAGTISASTVLDGFTIRDGYANAQLPLSLGAGLYCNGNVSGRSCSPTLSRLRFLANRASYGGAVLLRADGEGIASPKFADVEFNGNIATHLGGAIYVWIDHHGVASPTIQRATFTANLADQGGAIYNAAGGAGGTANAVIVDATFQGNDASIGSNIGNGGAIYNRAVGGSAAMKLTNVTFSGNTASGINHFGGAMVNEGVGATPVITNTIFWGDAANAQPEFYNVVSAQPTFSHSIVAGSGGSARGTRRSASTAAAISTWTRNSARWRTTAASHRRCCPRARARSSTPATTASVQPSTSAA